MTPILEQVCARHRHPRRASTATRWPARPAPPTRPARRAATRDAAGRKHYNASFAGFVPGREPAVHDPRVDRRAAQLGRPLRRDRGRAAVRRRRPGGAAPLPGAADPRTAGTCPWARTSHELGRAGGSGAGAADARPSTALVDATPGLAATVARRRVGERDRHGARLPRRRGRRPVLLPARRARRRPRLRRRRRRRPAPSPLLVERPPRPRGGPGGRGRRPAPPWRRWPPPSTATRRERMTVVGVTGTNGKTTTTHLLASVFEHAGLPTGVIGTLTGLAHHARGARAAGAAGGASATRAGGPSRWRCRRTPWPAPGRRHALRRRRVHQPRPGPPRLPRHDGALLRRQGPPVHARPRRRTASSTATIPTAGCCSTRRRSP